MHLARLLLFCVIGGCFFALGAYCRASAGVLILRTVSEPEQNDAALWGAGRCDPMPRNPWRETVRDAASYVRPPRRERQVGMLTVAKEGGSGNTVLPLFADKSCTNRDRFFYSSRTDGFNPIVVPVFQKGRNCMTDRIGCETLYDGDTVQVPALGEGKTFEVSLYEDLY